MLGFTRKIKVNLSSWNLMIAPTPDHNSRFQIFLFFFQFFLGTKQPLWRSHIYIYEDNLPILESKRGSSSLSRRWDGDSAGIWTETDMPFSCSFRRGLRRVLWAPATRGMGLAIWESKGEKEMKDKMGFCEGKLETEEKVDADAIYYSTRNYYNTPYRTMIAPMSAKPAMAPSVWLFLVGQKLINKYGYESGWCMDTYRLGIANC